MGWARIGAAIATAACLAGGSADAADPAALDCLSFDLDFDGKPGPVRQVTLSNGCPTPVRVEVCFLVDHIHGPFRNPQRVRRTVSAGETSRFHPINQAAEPFRYKVNACRADTGACRVDGFACTPAFVGEDGATPTVVECTAGIDAAAFEIPYGSTRIAFGVPLPQPGPWTCSEGILTEEAGSAVWSTPKNSTLR